MQCKGSDMYVPISVDLNVNLTVNNGKLGLHKLHLIHLKSHYIPYGYLTLLALRNNASGF